MITSLFAQEVHLPALSVLIVTPRYKYKNLIDDEKRFDGFTIKGIIVHLPETTIEPKCFVLLSSEYDHQACKYRVVQQQTHR